MTNGSAQWTSCGILLTFAGVVASFFLLCISCSLFFSFFLSSFVSLWSVVFLFCINTQLWGRHSAMVFVSIVFYSYFDLLHGEQENRVWRIMQSRNMKSTWNLAADSKYDDDDGRSEMLFNISNIWWQKFSRWLKWFMLHTYTQRVRKRV